MPSSSHESNHADASSGASIFSFASAVFSETYTKSILTPPPATSNAAVIYALESARENPDGHYDHTVEEILEGALTSIMGRVQAEPNSYVMSRDEFAVFNFFQHRFADNAIARLARERYWSNIRA